MFNEIQIISVKGKQQKVRAIRIDNVMLVATGTVLKIAQIHDEAWLDSKILPDPLKAIDMLQRAKNRPDIFTFCQRDFKTELQYDFPSELTNIAAIPITNYDFWWTKQISAKTRNMVRKAQKKGVDVQVVPFNDKLIAGIVKIINETPIRQGRPFWHYGKNGELLREENSSYLETSDFLGAHAMGELIGYMKMVYLGEVAGIMQILSMVKDRDKAPNNALLSKAVETCASKGIKYLFYGEYIYGKKEHSSLLDFKKSNGFEKIEFPRYYAPLTFKGQLAIKFGLHKGWTNILPASIKSALTDLRSHYYVWRERNS
jgi:hypothetical protein